MITVAALAGVSMVATQDCNPQFAFTGDAVLLSAAAIRGVVNSVLLVSGGASERCWELVYVEGVVANLEGDVLAIVDCHHKVFSDGADRWRSVGTPF